MKNQGQPIYQSGMAPKKKKPHRSLPSSRDIERVFELLSDFYGDPQTELTYQNPYQLLIAVILSAQCTDARVNLTTPALFKRFPTPQSLARAKPGEVEKIIHSCGFYRMKTKSIISTSKDLVERFDGKVPNTLEELTSLHGVGRKTASVVLNQAFDLPAIAVDTHVKRVSNRLGWAHSENPDVIERQLMELLPKSLWASVNGLLILHGRRICKARKPNCPECPISKYCDYYQRSL